MMFTLNPVGIIHSCFKEKFGIPRQAGLVPEARAVLEILPPYDREEAFRGLDEFSHIWLIFVFHACIREKWKPTVRPPRLGGNKRIGVFASRSDFRPNPLGLSALELEKISKENGKLCLYLKGVDLLDQTPVLDIKPYISWADSIPFAESGFASTLPDMNMPVEFTPEALNLCMEKEKQIPGFKNFIIQMLRADPRPAYYSQKHEKEFFGTRVFDIDVKWKFTEGRILVFSFEQAG